MRGVSPVVATVLMIAIAIAAAVIAYSWITTFQQRQQQNVTSSANFGALKIDYAYCDSVNLRVGITNISPKYAVTSGTAVKVIIEDTTGVVRDTCEQTLTSDLAAGASTEISCANECNSAVSGLSKGSYYIKVVAGTATALGGPYELNVV